MATEPRGSGKESKSGSAGVEEDATKQANVVLDVMLRAGHAQVAAMAATCTFLSSWAQSADRYAQSWEPKFVISWRAACLRMRRRRASPTRRPHIFVN